VDVEDWFHICGVPALARPTWDRHPSRVERTTRRLLDMLDRSRVRATFFVLGWIADRHPSLVADIAGAGHEIGSHSHHHDRVYELTPATFAGDLTRSLDALRGCGVGDVRAFRAPEWSINRRSLWALDTLVRAGISIDSSMAPLRIVGDPDFRQDVHRQKTPAGDIVECPPAVARRFGQNIPMGGGWGLRAAQPARALKALEGRLAAGRPAILWVHPWEVDDDPPQVALPASLRFAHYFRLAGFAQRLETILRGGPFGPLGDLARAGIVT
jgi:polysaccharide deacetylase family protein (PEP-CTERM system associated)